MDYRLTQLESELNRLQADCARMNVLLESLQNRKHDSSDVAFLAALIMMLTFSSWLFFSVG